MTLDTAPKFGWRPRALIGHLIALRHHDVTAKRLSDMKNCDTGCLFFYIEEADVEHRVTPRIEHI